MKLLCVGGVGRGGVKVTPKRNQDCPVSQLISRTNSVKAISSSSKVLDHSEGNGFRVRACRDRKP